MTKDFDAASHAINFMGDCKRVLASIKALSLLDLDTLHDPEAAIQLIEDTLVWLKEIHAELVKIQERRSGSGTSKE